MEVGDGESYCEEDDLESASVDAGDMCLPEEEPCRYVTERFGVE